MKTMAFSKIIWAVDAMEDPSRNAGAIFLLGALARATESEIQPVYIQSPPYLSEPFRALAEKNLKTLVESSRIPTMLPGKILKSTASSTRNDVDVLIKYVRAQGGDALIVATHSRTGLPRMFVGSFAELLAFTSPVPIFTVNPDTKVRERISKILFPTDFGQRYRSAYERAVMIAKILDAELTIYYKEPPVPGYSISREPNGRESREAQKRMERAEEWRAWAASFHVPVQIQIDNQPGHVVTAIDQYAENQNFDLIAIATEASTVSAAIIGSHARQMIREAKCPVWVFHVENEE